jgi:hypothetical protein
MPTDAEFDAMVEAELAADFRIAKENKRAEIAERLRREETKKWHDRVNQRHPTEDKYSGLGPEGYAARLKMMAERARADNEQMDRANARVVDGNLKAQRAAAAGGRSGFTIK